MTPRAHVTSWLERSGQVTFATYAIPAAFGAYFCMYAVRKPFAAGDYAGELWGVDLKIVLVVAQVLGYALSKFVGIKVVPEVSASRRAASLLALVAMAELALVGFALAPVSLKPVAMFCNGLPLGMVWGLVFAHLEGRRSSEILGAGLVASGVVKTVGRALTDQVGVSEAWMPAATGILFFPLFVLCVWLLSALPAPNDADVRARTKRAPMDAEARRSFFWTFAPGLLPLTALYVFLTAFRDFRDNFQRQLFDELGIHEASAFAQTETISAFAVLVVLAGIYAIRGNRRAVFVIHGVMLAGMLLLLGSTLAWQRGAISGLTWMSCVGGGLYLAYVPYGCVLFDRIIAATRVVATSVFMIYVTDAMGYLGSVGILLYKNFLAGERSWLEFYQDAAIATSTIGILGFVLSAIYFSRKIPRTNDADTLGAATPLHGE
ncbi:MAG: DUF5690 family protein [Nannocystaceae bacterium]